MRWLAAAVTTEVTVRSTVPIKMDVKLDGPEHTLITKLYIPKKQV